MRRRRAIRGRGLPHMQRQKSTDAVHEGRSEHHRNPHHAKPAVCRGDIQKGLCGEDSEVKNFQPAWDVFSSMSANKLASPATLGIASACACCRQSIMHVLTIHL